MTREECKERLNRPTPLFEITIEDRSLILKPRFPILEVPGKLDGTLNALLRAELERVAFRTLITQDSLSWLCDKLSAYTVRLWEEGKVVILGPKWTTDHAKAEMIHVWRGKIMVNSQCPFQNKDKADLERARELLRKCLPYLPNEASRMLEAASGSFPICMPNRTIELLKKAYWDGAKEVTNLQYSIEDFLNDT